MILQKSLGERYEINELIGKGGAGSVYKARDKMLDVNVAIKVMNSDLTGTAAARLQREAIAAGKLKHKNIAKVFDFGLTADDLTYMVMEYLPGKTLYDLIKERGKLTADEAIPIFLQLCDGLAFAHNNGVIHRDLKPSNIILMKDGQSWVAKILDFGVAYLESDQKLTTTGAVVGSPLYMSPEQILSQEVTVQSDIYSLGCLMYETLSGAPPFRGETVLETLQMHKSTLPKALDESFSVPQPLAAVVHQCLEKEAQARQLNVAVLKEMLEKTVEQTRARPEEIKPQETIEPVFVQKEKGFSKTYTVFFVILAVTILFVAGANYSNIRKQFTPEVVIPPSKDTDERRAKLHNADADKIYEGNEKIASIRYSATSHFGMGTEVNDEDLKAIQNNDLTKLRLEGKGLTGSGFKYLAGSPIRTIELVCNELKPENLKYFGQLPNLREFAIQSETLKDADLKYLSGAGKLNSLYLNSPCLTEKGLAEMLPVQSIVNVDLERGQYSDNVAEVLHQFKNLNSLTINSKHLSKNFGVRLAKKTNVSYLNLNVPYSNESFAAVCKMPLLYFNLTGQKLDRDMLEKLVSIKTLRGICLSSIKCKEADYAILAKLPKMERLDLALSGKMSDAMINALVKTQFEIVDVGASQITRDQFFKFMKMPNIKTLKCGACPNLSEKDTESFLHLYPIHWKKPISVVE